MKDNFDIALGFLKKISENEQAQKILQREILQIVLFGSVARSEDRAASDIDIAIIHNSKKPDKLQTVINKLKHEKIQLTYMHVFKLSKEPELVSALTGDGILLYGHLINVKFGKNILEPKMLVIYELSHLPKKEQMKINRALHGSVSKSEYKGKKYKTEIAGILNEKGVEKLSKAVVLTDRKKAAKLLNILKMYNAKWKEISVWR